jgi:hypothetical protein
VTGVGVLDEEDASLFIASISVYLNWVFKYIVSDAIGKKPDLNPSPESLAAAPSS